MQSVVRTHAPALAHSHPLFPGVGIGVRDCVRAHMYCDFALTERDWFRRGVMWAGAQDLPETPKSSKRRNIRAIDTTLSQEEKDAWEEELKERKLLEQLTAKRAADTADYSDSDDDDFGGGGGGGGGSARGIRINDNILVADKEEAVFVHPDISRMLKPHQKEGIRFMWHRLIKTMAEVGNPGTDRKDRVYGGILAHSMGLGKTLQTIALIHTVLTCKTINRQGAAAAAKRKGKEKEGSGVDGDGDSAGAGTNIGTVLILVPKNVLYNWHKEFVKWIPDQAWTKKYVKVLNSDVMTDIMERSELLKAWAGTGGVMIMTDSMYVKMMEESTSATQKYTAQVKRKIKERAEMYLHKPGPDMIFIDEAHMLGREVSKRTERILGIHTRRRMLLTGTPMQNSLKEYFSMIDFIYPKYMGTKEQFANRFTNPIENGQYADSTEKDILMMRQRLCVLQSKVRRMVQRKDQAVFLNELKGKREYVIYIPLTKEQRKLYKRYNDYAAYNEDSSGAPGKGSFFAAFQSLQKVSSHPYTLRIEENQAKQKAKSKVAAKKKKERELLDGFDDLDAGGGGGGSKASSPGKIEATDSDADDPLEEDEEEDDAFDTTSSSNSKKNKWFSTYPKKEPNDLLRDSGKFKLFFEILQLCEAKGDKLVLFTQHVVTLDVLEVQLKRMKWKKNQKYLRIDGKDDAKDRLEMADKFNEAGSKLQLIIASVKATALGINFTGANRVIIFDHSHNPVHEIQAIARTYRYGQQKEVVVYRFVADRTIDQKIYVRQCEYGETTDGCFEI